MMAYAANITLAMIVVTAWHIVAVLVIKSRVSKYAVDPFMDIFRTLIIADFVMAICLSVVLWAS